MVSSVEFVSFFEHAKHEPVRNFSRTMQLTFTHEAHVQNGERKTGVSVAFTVRACDAGPVLAQQSRQIDDVIQAPELLQELFQQGTELLLINLPHVWTGQAGQQAQPQVLLCDLQPRACTVVCCKAVLVTARDANLPLSADEQSTMRGSIAGTACHAAWLAICLQDEAAASHAAKLTKADSLLDFQQPAKRLHDQVGMLQLADLMQGILLVCPPWDSFMFVAGARASWMARHIPHISHHEERWHPGGNGVEDSGKPACRERCTSTTSRASAGPDRRV